MERKTKTFEQWMQEHVKSVTFAMTKYSYEFIDSQLNKTVTKINKL